MNPEGTAIHHTFTLVCDDIRVELGNRFSLMGVFHAIVAQQLPTVLIKIAAISHWQGSGTGITQSRIVNADRTEMIVESNTAQIDLATGGFTYNMTFFVNVVLPQTGIYLVQTLLDSQVVGEVPFEVVLHEHGAV